jgi:rhodanese-related sulfurtransferase/rubrerythrin
MRWRQFFTPVRSIDAAEARPMIERQSPRELLLLDVRQPGEYEAGHIPGARLLPLPDLGDRLAELNPAHPILVYCAVGGRSRMAAQILAGKGFETVYNLSGGFKAWRSRSAVGPEEKGLHLLTGDETPEEALALAYSLEAGLRDFYLSTAPKVANPEAGSLFEKLAGIEVKHQDRVYELYSSMAARPLSREDFAERTVSGVVEGGLSTEEYIALFSPDLDDPTDVVDVAMSIEAQAFDLYTRAARKCSDAGSRGAFLQIAEEEKVHMAELGRLIDRLATPPR